MTESICRWGILGGATIAQKNWQAIRKCGNGQVVAVASRSVERADRFIQQCQDSCPFPSAPRAVGCYDDLINASDIDAIYIPLPTGLRRQWVIKAAEAGKHVLVEKPVGVNANEVQQMIDACHKHNVQFMDGVMFMHSQRLPAVQQVLKGSDSIGKMRRITSQFSFSAPPEFFTGNIRATGLEPAGCVGDLGWYCIRMILWLVDWKMPTRITATCLSSVPGIDGAAAVPTEFSAELFFDDGVSASFYCSFISELQQLIRISGDQGYVEWNDFVLPHFGCENHFDLVRSQFHVNACDFEMQPHSKRFQVNEYSNGHSSAQESQMFRTFGQAVLSGQIDPFWPRISLATQRVLDACLHAASSKSAVNLH